MFLAWGNQNILPLISQICNSRILYFFPLFSILSLLIVLITSFHGIHGETSILQLKIWVRSTSMYMVLKALIDFNFLLIERGPDSLLEKKKFCVFQWYFCEDQLNKNKLETPVNIFKTTDHFICLYHIPNICLSSVQCTVYIAHTS